MSRCLIERDLEDVNATLVRARAECDKFRSLWVGDDTGGHYKLRTPLGSIEGTYTVDGKHVCFQVEKKPRIVPCALIERVLDEFLRDG
ncbi:MAG: hypothetical protein H6719_26145 [Sandaracinaceae bacterium]|nr:hypothetical protein [Sandaracinaceae bacterium]